jgi:hypothetical protein
MGILPNRGVLGGFLNPRAPFGGRVVPYWAVVLAMASKAPWERGGVNPKFGLGDLLSIAYLSLIHLCKF